MKSIVVNGIIVNNRKIMAQTQSILGDKVVNIPKFLISFPSKTLVEIYSLAKSKTQI